MTKHFETKVEPKRYGSFLGADRQGRLVLEVKANLPSFEAFAEYELKEVVPYTIELQGTPCVAVEGQSNVGDILMIGTEFHVVNKFDTTASAAKKLPTKMRRVVMEEVA